MKVFSRLRRGLVALCMVYPGSKAQAVEKYKVDDLIDRAVSRNAELKAYELDARSQDERSSQAALWDDPNLDLGIENRVQPSLGGTDSGRVGVSQFINRPGRLGARVDVAQALFRNSKIEYEVSRIQLRATLIKLIYAYKISVERTQHAKERVDRIATVNTYLNSRPFVAPLARAQVLIVRSKLSILQKQLREFDAERKSNWSNLNLYLGLEAEPLIDLKWYRTPKDLMEADLLLKAEKTNPDVRRASVRVEASDAEARLAKAEAWPGFTLSGQYSNGNGYQPERVYGLGLSFPIPVLNGNRGNIRAAAAAAQASNSRLDWERSKLKYTLESMIAKYKAAATSLRAMSVDDIGKNDSEMNSIDRFFKRGQVDLITYLEADQQHFDNFNTALEVQSEYLQALSDVLFLVGEAPLASEI